MNALICLILFFCSPVLFAANEGPHGGDGVFIKNKLYLLDLVEAGVHQKPWVSPDLVPSSETLKRLRSIFVEPTFPVSLMASKLEEIRNYNSFLALQIEESLALFQWKLTKLPLKDIQDEDSAVRFKGKLVQLASRRNTTVLINLPAWKRLDPINRAALVFHEIFFAMQSPVPYVRNGVLIQEQFSDKVRELTGYLFSPAMKLKGKRQFDLIVAADLWANSWIEVPNFFLENRQNDMIFTALKLRYGVFISHLDLKDFIEQAERDSAELQNLCDNLSGFPEGVSVSLYVEGSRPVLETYVGEGGPSTYVEIKSFSAKIGGDYLFQTVKSCPEELEKFLAQAQAELKQAIAP